MWTALFASVLCNNIIGMLWYSPLLFLNTMIETTHLDPTGANMSMGIVFATNVLVPLCVLLSELNSYRL